MNRFIPSVFKMSIGLVCLLNTIKINAQDLYPKVVAIYPSADSIPVNVTRFYIEFSKPMQEMNILKHVKLTNNKGENISGVFFENQYELWDNDRKKVTLLVDPGRVKKGLYARNNLGRAFDEGLNYTLTVDSFLLDFDNHNLVASFSKSFVATKEDTIPPKVELWKYSIPKCNTREPFIINFNDKLDHILAKSFLAVTFNKEKIEGNIELNNNEQQWVFTPDKEWKSGDYKIFINKRLEDIATNSMNQLFDHKPEDFRVTSTNDLTMNFTIK
ncbi:MAG: hypothetical protein P8Q42_05450 [Flavobacteriales bacterium]|nr:hypothetical protein [Flavobacteriales bacterium]